MTAGRGDRGDGRVAALAPRRAGAPDAGARRRELASAAATLAALPLTLGFFKDELFFGAAAGARPGRGGAGRRRAPRSRSPTSGASGSGCSPGARRTRPHAIPALLVAPVVVLAAHRARRRLRRRAVRRAWPRTPRRSPTAQPVDVDPAYHLDARAENVMALAAWALGAALLLVPRVRGRWPRAVAARRRPLGPRRLVRRRSLLRAQRVSRTALHDAEVRDLRNSIAAVLVPDRRPRRARLRVHADARARTPSARSRPGTCRSSSLLVLCRGRGVHRRPRPRAGCGRCSRCRCSGFALAGRLRRHGRAGRRARRGRSSRRSSRSCSSASSRACRTAAAGRERARGAPRPAQRRSPGSSRASARSP